MRTMEAENVIEMLHITKEFPGIIANDESHSNSEEGKSTPSWGRTAQANPP